MKATDIHLSSLEELCGYLFTYSRLDHTLFMHEYVARMYELKKIQSRDMGLHYFLVNL